MDMENNIPVEEPEQSHASQAEIMDTAQPAVEPELPVEEAVSTDAEQLTEPEAAPEPSAEDTQESEADTVPPADGQTEEAATESAADDASGDAPLSPEELLYWQRRRKRCRGALRFWIGILAVVLAGLILLCCAMTPLRSVLEQYEAAQYDHVGEAVYELLFADPDWELLYDLAGVENTIYEGRDAYVQYMTEKVDGRELTMVETSAGLSGQRRYLLRCEDETLAAFDLCSTEDPGALFPGWTLSDVEVYFTRSESVAVMTLPENTVYINGVPLNESSITVSVCTAAEDYLPEDVHGYRWVQLNVEGFLVEPEVIVLDAYNNPVSVYYSEANDLYSTQIPESPEMTDEEYAIVYDAIKAQAQFALRAINIAQLRQYFDSGSQAYADLCDADPFVKSYQSYTYNDEALTVTDFRRYSDDLFSVRVQLSMSIKIRWKTYETYELDATYFFTRGGSGVYLVSDIVEDDLTRQITKYHLGYYSGDTLLGENMAEATATVFTPPTVYDSDGNAPTGWAIREQDGSYTIVLENQGDGTYTLAEGQTLRPMDLYPVYITAVSAE